MALSELEPIWLACARALDLPVERGGDSYVHFDGRTLHISTDEALDEDDSLAQLVLHEVCHLLVQGPAHRHMRDWNLDNTGADPFDDEREKAAVRLQAHLAGAHGLRGSLFPTTVVRPFFESLPDDALDGADASAVMAREAATRAGKAPFHRALSEALRATAAALSKALHPSGGVLRADLRCGDCAWFDGSCVATNAPIVVTADSPGCARHQTALDCQACGACCRSGYDVVPAEADEVIVRHAALVVARSDGFDLRRTTVGDEDRCASLEGRDRYACRVYADRPRACADLPAGSEACLTARRRVGLSPA